MAEEVVSQEGHEDGNEFQELRLALVLNGGVSLAVWMGGATVEINRLVNGEPPYDAILGLTRTSARVDVIAGASAGGINGALLATMIAHDNDRATELATLRQMWLEEGNFVGLLRSPLQNAPPSMLKGDEYFLLRLRDAFDRLSSAGRTDPIDYPVRLIITTTLMKPAARGFADDFGSLVPDADHRGEFSFRRGPDVDDDFADSEIVNRLALAARSTASFPVAFEPSFVPVGVTTEEQLKDRDRPDMKGFVNFSSSRFAVDGGVLVNKPFRPAIRAIFAQPATDQPVRRVLAYVVPDPGRPGDDGPQDRNEEQTLTEVGLASLVTMPRAESVARELEEIADHNRKVRAQRVLREHLLAPTDPSALAIGSLAAEFFDPFLTLRSQRIVDRLTAAIDPFGGRFEGLGDAAWNGEELREIIATDRAPWLPSGPPSEETTVGPWLWGNDTVEQMGAIVLDLLRRGLNLAPSSGVRRQLGSLRSALHSALRDLRRGALRLEPRFWEEQGSLALAFWTARAAAQESADPSQAVGSIPRTSWRRTPFDDWLQAIDPEAASPGAVANRIASILTDAAPDLISVSAGEPDNQGRGGIRSDIGLERMVRSMVPRAALAPGAATLQRLVSTAVVQQVMSAGGPELEQIVELIEVSADTPNGFDRRALASQKLTGRQLGHFGAFYKRSWRANDWMWGRLDGAARLSQIVVDPARLRQRGFTSAQAVEDIEAIALASDDEDAREVLADGSPRGWDRAKALRELAFLDDPQAPMPKSLPVCARSVARRIQLGILQDELAQVATAIEFDRDEAGAKEPDAAIDFAHATREAQQRDGVPIGVSLSPKSAKQLFPRCRVGEEVILKDAGSDLFTNTVTTAAAVAVTAVSGRRSGLIGPLRAILGSIRGILLTLWVLARSAVTKSRSGFATLLLLLAVGGTLLALSAIGNVALPGPLAALGTLLLIAGVALAALRAGTVGAFILTVFIILTIVALAVAPAILVHELIDPGATGWAGYVRRLVPPVTFVIALVLSGMLLGLVRAPGARRRDTNRRASP